MKEQSDTINAVTHKFSVDGREGYLTIGFYPDGSPCDCQWTISKNGSTFGGMADTIAALITLCFQSGIPVEKVSEVLKLQEFEPMGRTYNDDIPMAKSMPNYIGKWLEKYFGEERKELVLNGHAINGKEYTP